MNNLDNFNIDTDLKNKAISIITLIKLEDFDTEEKIYGNIYFFEVIRNMIPVFSLAYMSHLQRFFIQTRTEFYSLVSEELKNEIRDFIDNNKANVQGG